MYQAKETRYDKMVYNRCGNSGLKLPEVSGFWHIFRGHRGLRKYAPDGIYRF